MKISHIYKRLIFVVAIAILSACSKEFIDRPPLNAIAAETYFTNKEDMLASTSALYNVAWFDYNGTASWSIGDARGGVLFTQYQNPNFYKFRVEANDGQVAGAWNSFFSIVSNSNVIAKNILQFTKAGVDSVDKNAALGECKFMRGTAYFYLIRNWAEGVPLLEDHDAYLYVKDIRLNTPSSVYEFIIRDLSYARSHLPLIPAQPGRLTSWAAKGMLAKVYLFRAAYKKGLGQDFTSDLDSAKALAGDVCRNSGLALMPNYEDLFKTEFNSSKGKNTEYLFALQWVAGQGYNYGNLNQAFLAFDTKVTGQNDGWGGGVGAPTSMLKYYLTHPEDSFRRKATFFFPGETYDYVSYPNPDPDDPTKSVLGKLVVPTANRSKANVKKYIVGRAEDNEGQVFPQNIGSTNINTYILRLAEVYLIYAEATVGLDFNGSTTDAEALKYFNMVRERAKIAPITGPLTFKHIYDEKRIELAMEAQNYYELVKIYYQDKQRAIDMIDTTQMGDYYIDMVANSSPKRWELSFETWHDLEYIHVEDGYFFLPIPALEKVKVPSLSLPAVDYDFSKYK